MTIYYFNYTYQYEKLADLINYLQNHYKVKYKEIIDMPSAFSFSLLGLLNICLNKKIVLFETGNNIEKVKKCGNCNFPIEKNDLKPFDGSDDLVCRNCNGVPR